MYKCTVLPEYDHKPFDTITLPRHLFHGRQDPKSPSHLKYEEISVSINHLNGTGRSPYGSTVITGEIHLSFIIRFTLLLLMQSGLHRKKIVDAVKKKTCTKNLV